MGKVTGFLEIEREEPRYEPASDRIRHFGEFTIPMTEGRIVDQAARCMDCGIPFCHGDTGCPVNNQIPDWNDLVYNGDWEEAARNLHSTNNFPEFTGRIEPKAGGLMRYGIPDFKMEKDHIDFRVAQMEAEGVTFHYGVNVGVTTPLSDLQARHDAILMCGGSEKPRDVEAEGTHFAGVHYAMPFLVQQNRRLGGEDVSNQVQLTAAGKHVVVVGGGDTASDCVGTSFRQGAIAVTQLDVRPMPPELENKLTNWPNWAVKMRTSSSQAEGAIREFAAGTMKIIGDAKGRVTGVECARVDRSRQPIPGTEFIIKADLVLMAIGFASPVHEGMLEQLGAQLDKRGNLFADTMSYKTTVPKVYAAGDMRRGQSLVVWAIREGRQAARSIDFDLMGKTSLPR